MKIGIATCLYCHRHAPVQALANACIRVSSRLYRRGAMPIQEHADANQRCWHRQYILMKSLESPDYFWILSMKRSIILLAATNELISLLSTWFSVLPSISTTAGLL